MVISTESPIDLSELDVSNAFVRTYDEAVVYADMDGETILHDGPARVLANGWVELPSGRTLSPDAVHHIDPAPAVDDTDEASDRRDASEPGW